MTTLGELIGSAQKDTPVVVLLAALILAAAGLIARRVYRSVSESQARQGTRLGDLESAINSETIRRRQLEQTLREHGVRLPYWPGDPAELYLAGARDDDDRDDLADDGPATRHYPHTPPTPARRYAP